MASNNEYKVQSFKRFDASDISISSLKTTKGFLFEGGDSLTGSNVNVNRFIGTQGNYLITQSLTGQISGEEQYSVLVYDSIKQLYYTNYISGSEGGISFANTASFNPDGTITPSSGSDPVYQTNYYNYESTTLNPQKTFNAESIGVISIPNKLYGDVLEPGSFKIESSVSGTLYDDGEGRLYSTGESGNGTYYVGNIIYEHGIITITNQPEGELILPTPPVTPTITPTNSPTPSISFSATVTPTNTPTRTVTSATPTVTPSITPTNSRTPSRTVTTATPTVTPSKTPTSTATVTQTPTRTVTSATPTATVTKSTSVTPGESNTPTPSNTPTKTNTPTRTVTSATPTATVSSTPTRTVTSATPTVTASNTPTRTVTSATPTVTPSSTPTNTVTASNTPTRTVTSATPTVTASNTPTRTVTATNTPTRTVTSATPTNTPTPTKTSSVTPSNTPTRTRTRTVTSATPTVTASNTPTRTRTRTVTSATPTVTSTNTPTRTRTRTVTSPTPTVTASNTPTRTRTRTVTSATPTVTASNTPTRTRTRTVTSATPTVTSTSTNTPTRTRTVTSATPTVTATPTNTPTRTRTVTSATPTVTASNTPTRTKTVTRTASNTPTRTVTASNTPTITASNTPTRTRTASITASNTPTRTKTASRTASNTPTRTKTASRTASNTPTRTRTASVTASNTPTRTRTASNTPTRTRTASITATKTNTPTPSTSPIAFLYGLGTGSYDACNDPYVSLNLYDQTGGGELETNDYVYTGSLDANPIDYDTLRALLPGGSSDPMFASYNNQYYTISAEGGTNYAKVGTIGACVSRTPTPTITPTKTSTPTKTPTRTKTASNTPTRTATNTPTRTKTASRTASNTPTRTATNTPTRTKTASRTASKTPTKTVTKTRTPSPSSVFSALSLGFNTSNSPYGWNSPSAACTGSPTTTTVYLQLANTDWATAASNGATVYTNTALTNKFLPTDGNEYFRDPLNSSRYIRIDAFGEVVTYGNCPSLTPTRTPSETPISSNCDTAVLDIEFLFDESTSINSTQFQQMKDASVSIVEKLSSKLSSSPSSGIQIGLSSFATSTANILDLSANATTISSSINSNSQAGGSTNLTDGLNNAWAHVTGSNSRTVDKKIIVFTDGAPNNESTAADAASTISNTYVGGKRTEILAVGIGVNASTAAFLSSSISTVESGYLEVDDFANLDSFATSITNLLCAPLPTPTPTQTKTPTPTKTFTPTPSATRFLVGQITSLSGTETTSTLACAQFTATGFYSNVTTFSSITTGTIIYETSTSSPFNGQSYWFGIAPTAGPPTKAIQINNVGEVISISNCITPTPTSTPVATLSPTPTRTVTPSSGTSCNAITVGRDADDQTACSLTNLTIYSSTETGLVDGATYYAFSNCTKAFNSSGDYISDGFEFGTTNASGVYTALGLCSG